MSLQNPIERIFRRVEEVAVLVNRARFFKVAINVFRKCFNFLFGVELDGVGIQVSVELDCVVIITGRPNCHEQHGDDFEDHRKNQNANHEPVVATEVEESL